MYDKRGIQAWGLLLQAPIMYNTYVTIFDPNWYVAYRLAVPIDGPIKKSTSWSQWYIEILKFKYKNAE